MWKYLNMLLFYHEFLATPWLPYLSSCLTNDTDLPIFFAFSMNTDILQQTDDSAGGTEEAILNTTSCMHTLLYMCSRNANVSLGHAKSIVGKCIHLNGVIALTEHKCN